MKFNSTVIIELDQNNLLLYCEVWQLLETETLEHTIP